MRLEEQPGYLDFCMDGAYFSVCRASRYYIYLPALCIFWLFWRHFYISLLKTRMSLCHVLSTVPAICFKQMFGLRSEVIIWWLICFRRLQTWTYLPAGCSGPAYCAHVWVETHGATTRGPHDVALEQSHAPLANGIFPHSSLGIRSLGRPADGDFRHSGYGMETTPSNSRIAVFASDMSLR